MVYVSVSYFESLSYLLDGFVNIFSTPARLMWKFDVLYGSLTQPAWLLYLLVSLTFLPFLFSVFSCVSEWVGILQQTCQQTGVYKTKKNNLWPECLMNEQEQKNTNRKSAGLVKYWRWFRRVKVQKMSSSSVMKPHHDLNVSTITTYHPKNYLLKTSVVLKS